MKTTVYTITVNETGEAWTCQSLAECRQWAHGDFRMPVKHGLYESSAIVPDNAADFHLASECPALRAAELGQPYPPA